MNFPGYLSQFSQGWILEVQLYIRCLLFIIPYYISFFLILCVFGLIWIPCTKIYYIWSDWDVTFLRKWWPGLFLFILHNTYMNGSYQFDPRKVLILHEFFQLQYRWTCFGVCAFSFLSLLEDLEGSFAQYNSDLGWYCRELAFLCCGLGLITNPYVTCTLSLQWLLFVLSQRFFSL